MNSYRQAEIERRNQIKEIKGKVIEADYEKGLYRVSDGQGFESGWLPLKTNRAGGDQSYMALDMGEQVTIECSNGDPSQAHIVGSFYNNDSEQPSSSPDKHIMQYKNGTKIEHDRDNDSILVHLPSGGAITVNADGGTAWLGDINITGDINVKGNINVTGGDVKADSISLQNHTHGGVDSGSASTSKPK